MSQSWNKLALMLAVALLITAGHPLCARGSLQGVTMQLFAVLGWCGKHAEWPTLMAATRLGCDPGMQDQFVFVNRSTGNFQLGCQTFYPAIWNQ